MSDAPYTQNFVPIQSRKFAGSVESLQLCKSMDLVLLSSSSSLSLYRTLSWQKVVTISPEDDTKNKQVSPVTCWSPDGRWIAAATDTDVRLYGVEKIANPAGASFFGGSSTDAQHAFSVDHPVLGVYWFHVGRPHPTAWTSTKEELEEEVSWSYQSYYVDRSLEFLPHSSYLSQTDETDAGDQHFESGALLPECKTPLSVLVVATTHRLEFYIHGRFPLLKIPFSSSTAPPKVVASHDLTNFVVTSPCDGKVLLYELPFLKQHRYLLQSIASLHSAIASHTQTLERSVTEVLNSWKSSLKPLDLKIQPLLKLLKNYGVVDQPLGFVLKRYILVGHTSELSSIANAMDQFFTSVQMNDQLVQRMERTLQASLANVESLVKTGLVSPVQALSYQVQELAGIVQIHGGESDVIAAQELVATCETLWITMEAFHTSIVSSRFRIRDFCSWLRSAGSQVKARGTAPNSVQRENAAKRRVPQALLERLFGYLNTDFLQAKDPRSLSEHLLGIDVSKFLAPFQSSEEKRPNSPLSVATFRRPLVSLISARCEAQKAAEVVFAVPLSTIPKVVDPKEIISARGSSQSQSVVTAVHTRIGFESSVEMRRCDENDGETLGYVAPRILSATVPFDCRQWTLVAQSSGNVVTMHAVPLDPTARKQPIITPRPKICFISELVFPFKTVVQDIAFYSDDGKSSLASGGDSGTGKEGRQQLGVLLRGEYGVEMWLVTYDDLTWMKTTGSQSGLQMDPKARFRVCRNLGCEDGDQVVNARSRVVDVCDEASSLYLCGSRGIGAVLTFSNGVTSADCFDLEEDEDNYETDDEEE